MLLLSEFYPSYEVRCLLRMSSTPYKAVFCRYPHVESTGELPQVQDGSALVGNDRALHYVRDLTQLGTTLSASERAYSLGLLALVQSTLKGVERWSLYQGPKGGRRAAECIHRVTPAPLSWLVAAGLRSSNMERLAQGGLVEEAWVRERAVETYKALDTVLASNGGPFFFGSSPTPLDAAVFGHLSAIRHCEPGAWVKECAPGLVRFYVELRGRYFSGAEENSSKNPFDAEDRRLDKRRLEEGSTEGEAFFAPRFSSGVQASRQSPETEQLVKIGVTACILGVTGVMVWAVMTGGGRRRR